MEIKDYLRAIAAFGGRYPRITVGGTFSALLISWHYDGAGSSDPYNITLYFGLTLLAGSFIAEITHAVRQSYRPSTVQCLNQDVTLAPAEHVLRKYVSREMFQLLSVHSPTSSLDVFAVAEAGEEAFTRRQEVFALMKKTADDCTASLVTILGSGKSAPSANVLRFVYDIHPGGAFLFGDCNLASRNMFVFGYTKRQNNVNDCSDAMGKIIDDLRGLESFGGLPPITKINDGG